MAKSYTALFIKKMSIVSRVAMALEGQSDAGYTIIRKFQVVLYLTPQVVLYLTPQVFYTLVMKLRRVSRDVFTKCSQASASTRGTENESRFISVMQPGSASPLPALVCVISFHNDPFNVFYLVFIASFITIT